MTHLARVLALIIVACVVPRATLVAQSAPFTGGPAEVTLTAPGPAVPGTQFIVDVRVDLTGITGVCGGNPAVPAVLGGYVIPITFTSSDFVFVSASACTSPQFSTPPIATDPATANAAGQLTITASQTNESAPVGNVCVARLTFAVQPGAMSSPLTPVSPDLSSAFQNCARGGAGGPATIPAASIPFIAAAPAIPTFSGGSLALFAALLSVAGLVALKTLKG